MLSKRYESTEVDRILLPVPSGTCVDKQGSITIRRTAIPSMVVKFFNFRIFIELFIHKVN